MGFRFRAHAGQRTLGALRAHLRLAREVCNALRRADIDFHRRNGRGPTLAELRQLALDLRKRSEYYQRLHSQVAQGIADRFHSARRRSLGGSARRSPGEGKPHKYSLAYPQGGRRADRYYNASLNVLRRAGWEPPAAPVELRPLPAAIGYGQGGAVKQEASPFRAG
jgi:transposase